MRKRSHETLRARRCSVDMAVGRIIHLITRDRTSGEMFADLRVERNVERGFGVEVWRARRWIVHSGILMMGKDE
jgi:hypothetical protein